MAQMKTDVGIMGQGGKQPPGPPVNAIRSMAHLVTIIRNRGLDPELEKEVLKVIKGYPDGSLEYAYNNLNNTIFRCQEAITLRRVTTEAPKPEEPKEEYTPPPKKKWRVGSIDDIIFDKE